MKNAPSQSFYTGIKFLDEMFVAIEELKVKQDKILDEIECLKTQHGNSHLSLEYLTEKDAGLLLNKKSTWFFNMKKSGMLPYSKVGGKVFYAKKDIVQLIEKGMTQF